MSTNPMIDATGVTRRFGVTVAVDRLDLRVPRGEIFGLVGADGAGKTTTLRLLIGALTPDAGRIMVDGHDMARTPERARRRVGHVAQRFSLYTDLTVAENLAFTADLFGVSPHAAAARATRLLHLTDLTGARDRLAGFLSGGMKQKLALACALIHEPALLLLDEPTNGVDPIARREFWQLLTGLVIDGVTIVVSTTYLDEAEMCARVGFMAGGRLLVSGSPAAVRALARHPRVEARITDRALATRAAWTVPGVVDVEAIGDRLRVTLAPGTIVAPALTALAGALERIGVATTAPRSVAPTLEDAVIQLIANPELALEPPS